jgi:hypothetical protein
MVALISACTSLGSSPPAWLARSCTSTSRAASRFNRREITGRDLLFSELDEKFFDSLLTKEGKAFTKAYYESDEYIQDYAELLASDLESPYEVADTWENFDRLLPRLNERFQMWRNSRAV